MLNVQRHKLKEVISDIICPHKSVFKTPFKNDQLLNIYMYLTVTYGTKF